MSDSLFIAAAIAGLLQISATVIDFISQLSEALRIASRVVSELKAMDILLRRLNALINYLDGANEAGLVDVKSYAILEDFFTVLIDCVCTYTNLEDAVKRLNEKYIANLGNAINSVRWVLRRGEVDEMVSDLQNYKLSLTTVLGMFVAYVPISFEFL